MLTPRGDSGATVKVQYFGDINDFRKFALLRLLSGVGGFKIGVCWMLTEADDSKHGLSNASVSAFDTPHVVFLLAGRPEHARRVVAAAAESDRDGSPLKSFILDPA